MDRILMGFDNLFTFSLRNSVLLRATLRNSYSTKNPKNVPLAT